MIFILQYDYIYKYNITETHEKSFRKKIRKKISEKKSRANFFIERSPTKSSTPKNSEQKNPPAQPSPSNRNSKIFTWKKIAAIKNLPKKYYPIPHAKNFFNKKSTVKIFRKKIRNKKVTKKFCCQKSNRKKIIRPKKKKP